jgi:hypothetical protein
MAQREQVELISDLDGSRADETVRFSLDGTAYEIDLSAGQAGQMRDELSAYTKAASRRRRRAAAQKRRRRGAEPPGLREYAASRGSGVPDGSAVPSRIREEFEMLVNLGVVRPAEA